MSKGYWSSIVLGSLTREEYEGLKSAGMLYVYYPQACGIYEDDMAREKASRIDTIGQNGNDGSHYDEPTLWPYGVGDDYIDKIYNPPKDGMFVDDYVPSSTNEIVVSELHKIIQALVKIADTLEAEDGK